MISRYGRYEVLYKLGQGAMAQVFLARDPVLSRFVAVKVLHAELAARKDVLQRFFNEARTVAVVRNPHVVEVFDFGQEGKDLYLVMEFVDGLSLQGLLRQLRHGADPDGRGWAPSHPREAAMFFDPLDATVTAALMCQAAEGLSIAAQHGVVHRDIKPENLMINSQGYLKISDFGIAHVQDDSITKTGAVLGSPLFMSPEQARGLKPITSQADMFSLGAVCYSCLAGHPPFQGKTVTELFRKIASEPHTPLRRIRPELDPSLGNLIETLLQKEPAARGGGPRWLHKQLKGHLMALGVMDPAELIGSYLQALSARGVQTTWRMDAPDPYRQQTLLAGTAPVRIPLSDASASTAGTFASERFDRESARRLPSAALLIVLGILISAAVGVLWEFLHTMGNIPGSRLDRSAHLDGGGHGDGLGAFDSASAQALHSGPPVRESLAVGDAHSIDGQSARGPDTAGPGNGAAQGTEDEGGSPKGRDQASLMLKSSPPFAEAFLDGRYVGVTPVRVDLLVAGRHRVVLKIKHMPAIDTVLALKPGLQGFKFRVDDGTPSRLAVTPDADP